MSLKQKKFKFKPRIKLNHNVSKLLKHLQGIKNSNFVVYPPVLQIKIPSHQIYAYRLKHRSTLTSTVTCRERPFDNRKISWLLGPLLEADVLKWNPP